jgi:hypothetical protein
MFLVYVIAVGFLSPAAFFLAQNYDSSVIS